nr:polysaccharide biosynthesis tyrosine autokinase [Bifidobacterium samirii]
MENTGSVDNDVITIDVLGALKKHVVTAVITFVVVVAGVCAYTFTRTPMYTASAQLFATYRNTAADSSNANSYNAGASYISSQIATYPDLVKTEAVLQPVIDDLGLDTSVGALSRQVSASNPTDTMMLKVSVSDADPEMAAKIANAAAASLRDQITGSLYSEGGSELISPVNLAIVQKAGTPGSPSSPNVKMNLAVGLAGGLVLGVIAAVLKDLLDRRVRTVADVQAIVDETPILGTLTQGEVFTEKAPVMVGHASSREAEDLRRLRTNLTFMENGEGLSNVIVVTSSSPSEGKTTTSANLAVAFAENGAKVLLIDADVRNPSIAKSLDVENSVGLTHLVSGEVSSRDAIQKYWKSNLHVLTSGQQTLNPSVLLNSMAMKALIHQVADNYDHVIIDTAPMQVSNDAAVFAKEGAQLLMVAGLGVVEKRRLTTTMDELETLDIEPVGMVLNFAEQEKAKDSYYYYYYGEKDGKRQGRRHKKKGSKTGSQA